MKATIDQQNSTLQGQRHLFYFKEIGSTEADGCIGDCSYSNCAQSKWHKSYTTRLSCILQTGK
ncbi:hypothetical protein DPMN_098016 [Dreissena polymorpha]|uniref:Uncharacterized protein n=1 Tax=Dreissena polymorpha TaxID=45954 RepID=A0A9D4R591_DREPO|nr:hypothetical protein DPMN_098016 [Dreissena polymorpha]